MTIIFKHRSADGEGLAEKQGVLSTVLQGGSSKEEITSTAGPSWKEPLLFVVEIYHISTFSRFVISLYVYNSQAQPISTARRRPKSTTDRTEKVPRPDVARVRYLKRTNC